MKAFVIHIDLPQSLEVAKKCIASGKQFGVDVELHRGYMPSDNPLAMAEELQIPLKNFAEKYSRFENCLAAFLSHRSLWQWALDNNEEVLILEHDAIFIDEIPSNIPYKGVLSFGAPSYGKYITPSVLGVNKLVSKQYLPGAHAYMVHPKVVPLLLRACQTVAGPTDIFLSNRNFDFIEEYYPWKVMARDDFTTIQNQNGCVAKHRYGENYKIL
jgi:GR25 family glycosyltransferase involved in LPS biosynthesis